MATPTAARTLRLTTYEHSVGPDSLVFHVTALGYSWTRNLALLWEQRTTIGRKSQGAETTSSTRATCSPTPGSAPSAEFSDTKVLNVVT